MMAKLLKVLKSSRLLLLATVYFIVGILEWLAYFILTEFVSQRDEPSRGRIYAFFYILLVVLLLGTTIQLYKVGFLPYGQDTSMYTYICAYIHKFKHYNGELFNVNPYYYPYHTSAVYYSMITELTGSGMVAYPLLVAVYALALVYGGVLLSRLIGSKKSFSILAASILSIIFLSSPPLSGLDLLQQYVASVYAVYALYSLMKAGKILYRGHVEEIVLFLIFSIISVITHLTTIIILMVAILAYITLWRNRKLLLGVIIYIIILFIYLSYVAKTVGVLSSIRIFLHEILVGASQAPSIKAYSMLPNTRISLYSWALLPSLTTAFLVWKIGPLLKALANPRKRLEKNSELIFISSTILYGLLLLGASFLSKMTSVDLSRYFWVVAYIILFIITGVIFKEWVFKKLDLRLILILLVIVAPYTISAMYDSARNPTAGGLMLAPVTLTDRRELAPLAFYGASGYYVYAWHDAYIPLELSNRTIVFQPGAKDYRGMYLVLENVTIDAPVSVPPSSYLIVHCDAMTKWKLNNYIIIFSGTEHIIAMHYS